MGAPVVAWWAVYGTYVYLAAVVVASAASYYLSQKALGAIDPKSSSEYAADHGLRTNTRSTNEPLKVAYGLNRIGGNDIYYFGEGSDNEELWLVTTLCEGTCSGIKAITGQDQVWLDDKLENVYGSLLTYYFHDGAAAQTYDTNLNAVSGEWTDNLRNTCYIVWHLTYDRDYFQSIPQRNVLIEGKELYDFRDTSTAYSNNPVLCLYDYMTNTRYGMGISSAKLDTTTWTSAANYCDTKGWGLNFIVSRDETAQEVLDNILAHFRGSIVYWSGTFFLYYADLNDESSTMTIEDEHILQDSTGKAAVTISQATRFKRPDGLRVTFLDPDNEYISDSIPIGDDIGVLNDFKLLGAASRTQAMQLGVYNLERAQLDRTITGTFSDDCIQLAPHDIVTFNSTALAIADQLMRVSESTINADGTVNLTLTYEALALYDDDYNLITDNVYSCTLPDTTDAPPPVGSVVAAEEVYEVRLRRFSRLNIAFSAPVGYVWYSHVEVYYSVDDTNWEYLYDVNTDFSIDPIEEGVNAYVRLKTVSIFDTKTRDVNDYKIHKYIDGHDDNPDSLTSLEALANSNSVNIYSSKVSDSDVELYEFRLGTSWSGAIFLSALRSPNLSLIGVKPSGSGGHTFFCNTLCNNGQYGATPQSAAVVIFHPPDGWAVADSDACDYDGVGTHDNTEHTTYDGDDYLKCSHTAGVLTGTYTSPIYDLGASDRYLVYCLAGIVVTGSGTTWDSQIPLTTTGAELVTDGDFDDWTGDDLDSWTESNCDAAEDVAGQAGSCAEVTTSAANGYIAQTITVTAEKWYVMRGYYKNTAGDTAQFGVYDLDNSAWLSPLEFHDLADQDTDWTAFSYLFYAPTGCTSVSIRLAGKVNGDIVFFDTITVLQIDETASTVWSDINISTRTWTEIFELTAGPQVSMTLKYDDSSPPTNEISKMEILSAIVTCRYAQMEITITDPSTEVNALVNDFVLYYLQ